MSFGVVQSRGAIAAQSQNGNAGQQLLLLSASVPIVAALIPRMFKLLWRLPPIIYDTFLADLTEVWYRAVLNRLDKGQRVLDVGVGTGDAIVSTKDLIRSRDITLVGIDCNESRVDKARKAMEENDISDIVEVCKVDVYETADLQRLTRDCASNDVVFFDSAYFSGSLSLMKDPLQALIEVARVVKSGGKIYVTQTFQEETAVNALLKHSKPALRYISTVDFGQFVTNKQMLSLYASSGLKLVEHGILPGSIDNMFQSAYLSVLQVP